MFERDEDTIRAKVAELQPTLDEFAPRFFSTWRYIRLHNVASNLAMALAFRTGELATATAMREDAKRLDFLASCDLPVLSHVFGMIADGNPPRQVIDTALRAASAPTAPRTTGGT
jgi:hypothetical protein